jgi:hypothetical protein
MLPFVQKRQVSSPEWALYAFSRPVLKRTTLIALLVGSLLSLINQYDVIDKHEFTLKLTLRLVLNYIIPFTVSIISATVNRRLY